MLESLGGRMPRMGMALKTHSLMTQGRHQTAIIPINGAEHKLFRLREVLCARRVC